MPPSAIIVEDDADRLVMYAESLIPEYADEARLTVSSAPWRIDTTASDAAAVPDHDASDVAARHRPLVNHPARHISEKSCLDGWPTTPPTRLGPAPRAAQHDETENRPQHQEEDRQRSASSGLPPVGVQDLS